jgi:hypothetical protein
VTGVYWQVHRQQDREFVEHLHALRTSYPMPAPHHIAWFEHNCADLSGMPAGTAVTMLAPRNRVSARISGHALDGCRRFFVCMCHMHGITPEPRIKYGFATHIMVLSVGC